MYHAVLYEIGKMIYVFGIICLPMEKYEELYPVSKSWRVWVDELKTMAKNTQRQYPRVFIQFLERWSVDPEELFELKLKHSKSEDPRDRRGIESWVRISMKEIIDSGLAPSTARMTSKAVNSFFTAQNLEFSLRPREVPKTYYNGSRIILKDQIRELYERVGEEHRLRNRAIIMALKDSGLRISDLGSLDVGDYLKTKRVVSDDEIFVVLEPFATVKTGAYAYPVFGPESVAAIDAYLEERGAPALEEPLFVSRHNTRLSPTSMSTMFWKLKDKLDESRKISAHSLRKFFQTSMELSGLPKNWIGKYMGKMVGDSSRVYSQPEDLGDILEKKYIENYDALRVLGAEASAQVLDKQSQRIAELEKQLEEEHNKNQDITHIRLDKRINLRNKRYHKRN